jgi:hypothetical protein
LTDSSDSETADAKLEETLEAEHGLAHVIIVGIIAAVPLCVALWVGLIAFALRDSAAELVGPLAMAVFFGTWAGFVSKTHALEELDRKANRGGTKPVPPPGRDH